jgi:hypothetical protein
MALPAGTYQIGLPGDATLTIRQGDTWSVVFTITSNGVAVDLSSGVTASLKIKSTYGGTLLETATCSTPTAGGVITASLTPAETAALTATGDQRIRPLGVWDLNLTDGTNTATVVGGAVNLYMQVTD